MAFFFNFRSRTFDFKALSVRVGIKSVRIWIKVSKPVSKSTCE